MKNKTLKYDMIVLVVIVLCISLLFLLRQNHSGEYIEIKIDDVTYGRYDLSHDQTINVNSTNTVVIKNHEAYMKEATCPDKLCVKQGHISKKGQSIICLPHRLIVEVVDGKEGAQDGKVY